MNVETGIDQTAPVPGSDVVWADFKVEKDSFGSLVDKIVSGMTERILDGRLRVGAKMPSIRQLAKLLAISTFTVVEAYERLVSTGLLSARRGSGYFVSRKEVVQLRQPVGLPTLEAMRPLVADLYFGVSELLPVGASWLPPEWYGESMVIDAVRHAMRMPANRMRGYGHPLGFPALRQHLASTLSANLFEVAVDQIVMTHGSIHAFDIILRALTQPGDTVLVEDPGYANLPAMVRQHHCVPVGIPRDQNGLDLEALRRAAMTYRPKLMMVGTVLQNPLGTSLSHPQAHQLLKLAAEHNFWLVEGDTYRELASGAEPSLAAMDGLQRVIRVGSFSKTLSPAIRVGSIAAPEALVPALVQAKMLSGLTTSEINERAVFQAITTSAYRRMIERLSAQLRTACDLAVETLVDAGLEPLARPRGGMFVSAGWGSAPTAAFNARTVADMALRSGILLSPDSFFTIASSTSVWFRFNVVYASSPQLANFFREHRIAVGFSEAQDR